MRTYTKYIEIPEIDDIIYDCDNDIKGKIVCDPCYGEVFEVVWDNGDCEEYEFDRLTWDSGNNWWEI